MFPTFKEYFLCEIANTPRNREALSNAYSMNDQEATDAITAWSQTEHLIDKDPEVYGFPRNLKNINPRDIFSWSRAARHNGESPEVAKKHITDMLANLKQVQQQRERRKGEENDYAIIYQSSELHVYQPRSEGASCKLGAGTKWCTAATKSKNMFNDYINNKGVTLYYFHTKHEGKYALAVFPDGEMEAFDEEDNQIRIDDLMRSVHDHGADLKDIIPIPSPYDPLKNMCGRLITSTQKRFADESDVMDMDQLGDDILWKCGELMRADSAGFQQFRQETNYPDIALLAFKGEYHYHTTTGSVSDDNDEIISSFALKFFTSNALNPPGSMPETNKMFQRQVESTVVAHTDTLLKNNTSVEGKEIAEILARDIKHAFELNDGVVSDVLRLYSKRHLNGSWDNMHQLTFDLIAEKPHVVIGNTVTVQLLIFTMIEKGGRWKQLEDLVKSEIKASNQQGWNDDSSRILRLSEFYNRMVAGLLGEPEIRKYLPTYADIQPHNNMSS